MRTISRTALAAVDSRSSTAELFAGEGPAGQVADLGVVADEDLVQIGDLPLDDPPLVDAAVALEQQPVDVEIAGVACRAAAGSSPRRAELEEPAVQRRVS